MISSSRLVHRGGAAWLIAALALLAAVPTPARATAGGAAPGVSLKVLDAQAPPGGVVQMSVALTEPTPILAARALLVFDPLGPVLGVGVFSSTGAQSDVSGTAVTSDAGLTVETASPSAQFGTAAGLPIVTVAIDVPPDATPGATGGMAVDPAGSQWVDPAGHLYAQQVKGGTFQLVAAAPSIRNVSPGGGPLPAGATVAIEGVGFQPGAVVEIDGAIVDSVTFVSAGEVDVTLGVDADLHGRRVTLKNPDGQRSRYFSYLRAAPLAASARPLLAATEPIFSPVAVSAATYSAAAADAQFVALAVQNPGAADADVTVELRSSAAEVLAASTLALPPRTRVARDVGELFPGQVVPPDASLAVRASAPVQVLGMLGDEAAGRVSPLLPGAALP